MGVFKRGISPSFYPSIGRTSPSPLKERGIKVEDSSRGEVDKTEYLPCQSATLLLY